MASLTGVNPSISYNPDHLNSICPEILISNQKSIEFIKSMTSTISGSLCGILGLTNHLGFLFYLLTSFIVSSLIWFSTFIKSKSSTSSNQSLTYFKSSYTLWTSSLIDNLFTFILWWTLFYGLIHS
ncbi:uncharacterized protein MELLADRAFT_94286 [Melampsora larici-populina 98AG31]|uniref:ER membrane protein complex subunit 6 n=1 Tax=Melampsora larici-populina (strain 98AG31 / pathotype 3-4-7) TaxID=747676 RepID=F4S763_MELLP|nr:uncharacterized protein MELLADRAFT_94286 [Melampsora larici-populina 98AG31]EGF99524.1 hypothetical protein MELLADRAFT_94286 [Melampsora larici-populina 98AG31]